MRILLIDDDEQLMEVLAQKLNNQHYAVDIANNGEVGWEFILLFDFDLIVLDWMLPDMEGVELCQQIRAKGHRMPIMLLTARDRQNDKVLGLDAGADDYVVKPFDFDELTARIRALLRRDITIASPILEWQGLSLETKTHEVHYQRQLLPLTPKEYGIIELFMRHPQQVFSPGAIINNLWAGEDPPGEEAVRTHIKGLRQKLKVAGMEKDTIKTVYGVGYRLKSAEDYPDYHAPDQQNSLQPDKTATINQIWSKFRDLAFQRLADLENLIAAVEHDSFTKDLQEQARGSAHKLAGSLGCFGFPEGSKIAKKLETLLWEKPSQALDLATITQLTAALQIELQHQPFETTVKNALSQTVSLLIIDSHQDPHLRQQLAREAEQNQMKTYVAGDLSQAQAILNREAIDVLLHVIVFPDGEDLSFLEELHQRQPRLKIVAIAESPQLLDRLAFVRTGGNLILQHPVKPKIAVAAVAKLLENLGNAAKILIIDDDPQILLSLALSLEPWGFEIATLENSSQFWTTLQAFQPDLLVLDIDMPELNGIEICQILRSDRYWQYLPILFLSVHQDERTQDQAFIIGADDYVCKPVTGSVLAHRILNRLRRSKITSVS